MKLMVTVAFLLFVAAAAHGKERPKRALTIYDLVRGSDKDKKPEPAPAVVPKPQKPSSNFDGFKLEDALAPAAKPESDQQNAAEFQAEVKQQLNALFEIENLQMRMLQDMQSRRRP